jgi:hypothetical protein
MIHAVQWLNACLLIATSHVEGTGVAIKMTTKPAERNQCVSSVTWSHLQRAWHEKGAIKNNRLIINYLKDSQRLSCFESSRGPRRYGAKIDSG